jgi:hypothetical protein
MPWITLATFLITLPLVEYLIMLGYTYVVDKTGVVFAVMMRLSLYIIPILIIYLGSWWYLVSGLICKDPSNMGTSWIPIIIFGIIAFLSSIGLISYIWLYQAATSFAQTVQENIPGIASKLKVEVIKATPAPAATPAPTGTTSAVSSPAATPTATASATPSTVKTGPN